MARSLRLLGAVDARWHTRLRLSYDIEAVTSLEFPPDGTRCTVELPLIQRVLPLRSDGG